MKHTPIHIVEVVVANLLERTSSFDPEQVVFVPQGRKAVDAHYAERFKPYLPYVAFITFCSPAAAKAFAARAGRLTLKAALKEAVHFKCGSVVILDEEVRELARYPVTLLDEL